MVIHPILGCTSNRDTGTHGDGLPTLTTRSDSLSRCKHHNDRCYSASIDFYTGSESTRDCFSWVSIRNISFHFVSWHLATAFHPYILFRNSTFSKSFRHPKKKIRHLQIIPHFFVMFFSLLPQQKGGVIPYCSSLGNIQGCYHISGVKPRGKQKGEDQKDCAVRYHVVTW